MSTSSTAFAANTTRPLEDGELDMEPPVDKVSKKRARPTTEEEDQIFESAAKDEDDDEEEEAPESNAAPIFTRINGSMPAPADLFKIFNKRKPLLMSKASGKREPANFSLTSVKNQPEYSGDPKILQKSYLTLNSKDGDLVVPWGAELDERQATNKWRLSLPIKSAEHQAALQDIESFFKDDAMTDQANHFGSGFSSWKGADEKNPEMYPQSTIDMFWLPMYRPGKESKKTGTMGDPTLHMTIPTTEDDEVGLNSDGDPIFVCGKKALTRKDIEGKENRFSIKKMCFVLGGYWYGSNTLGLMAKVHRVVVARKKKYSKAKFEDSDSDGDGDEEEERPTKRRKTTA
jgi:hypothetical protein